MREIIVRKVERQGTVRRARMIAKKKPKTMKRKRNKSAIAC